MSTMRLRRLKADYDKICTMFSGKSPIRVKEARGTPPEKYQIEFLVTSLQQDPMTHALRSHNCLSPRSRSRRRTRVWRRNAG